MLLYEEGVCKTNPLCDITEKEAEYKLLSLNNTVRARQRYDGEFDIPFRFFVCLFVCLFLFVGW